MAYKYSCKDLGYDCSFKAEAATEEEIHAQIREHNREVHSLTDKQINDPVMIRKIRDALLNM